MTENSQERILRRGFPSRWSRLVAHKVILCSASSLFRRIFQITDVNDKTSGPISYSVINNGGVPGFSGIRLEKDGERDIIVISIAEHISYEMFHRVIEFLYTGLATIKDKNDSISETISIAGKDLFLAPLLSHLELFGCSDLVSICQNIQNNDVDLNPSIGTWLNDLCGAKAKQLFYNRPLFSDVSFKVEGKLIPAHKAILACRFVDFKIFC